MCDLCGFFYLLSNIFVKFGILLVEDVIWEGNLCRVFVIDVLLIDLYFFGFFWVGVGSFGG